MARKTASHERAEEEQIKKKNGATGKKHSEIRERLLIHDKAGWEDGMHHGEGRRSGGKKEKTDGLKGKTDKGLEESVVGRKPVGA